MNHKQRGVTMIEVLVSIVVVAVGILGLTALQGVSLRNTTTANLRSTAAILARDMADRMRANQAGLDAGNYNNLTGSATNPGCAASGCSAAQLATYDYWRWNQDIANTLPLGTGTVQLVSGSTRSLTITVQWDDERNPSALKSFSMVVTP